MRENVFGLGIRVLVGLQNEGRMSGIIIMYAHYLNFKADAIMNSLDCVPVYVMVTRFSA